ncbi:dynamin family protein [Brachyspira aalborgi]|uniref:dynamin family protein n=1 Tax=Brachyspira aalborgi TaxID=29522 RepID=UPI00266CFBD2|nr:dynamin family protein [Brachyspira aalborgi]
MILEEKEKTINAVLMEAAQSEEKHKKAIDKHKKVLDILSDRAEKNEQTEAFDKMRIVYNDLINKCIEYDLPSGKLFKNFDELLEKIEDAINFPLFYHKNIIALCGQFSSGKTSMINSFLEEDILPTDIARTTAINTFVIYDEEEGLYIRNCFGAQSKIEKEFYKEYNDFVTHTFTKEYDKDVHNMVKYVSLHTQKLKYENIALLDTPGYTGQGQDATEDDSNMAMKGIAQADNIIWVIDIDNGTIKNNDLEFLKKEELNGKDILIVFNKAEQKSEEDIDKIVEESKSLLDSRGIDYKDIVVYSSHQPENYKEGEEKLFNFFESENKSIERNYLEDLNKIFNEFIEYYEDLKEDLGNNLKVFRIVKLKSLNITTGAKDIETSLKKVEKDINSLNELIKALETAKEKCLDLMKDSLYYNNPEEYNKHRKMLKNKVKKSAKEKQDTKKSTSTQKEELGDSLENGQTFEEILKEISKEGARIGKEFGRIFGKDFGHEDKNERDFKSIKEYLKKGIDSYDINDFKSAKFYFDKILKINPENKDALKWREKVKRVKGI